MTHNGSKIDLDSIMDGYSLAGYIAAVPGVHDDLAFLYRPVDPLTDRKYGVRMRAVIDNKTLSDEDKELGCELLKIEMVVGQIQQWNLVDADDKPVPVSAGAVLRYFPGYRYARLLQIVSGGVASDLRPGEQPQQKKPGEPARETNDLEAAEKN